jgi:hypothetical protein
MLRSLSNLVMPESSPTANCQLPTVHQKLALPVSVSNVVTTWLTKALESMIFYRKFIKCCHKQADKGQKVYQLSTANCPSEVSPACQETTLVARQAGLAPGKNVVLRQTNNSLLYYSFKFQCYIEIFRQMAATNYVAVGISACSVFILVIYEYLIK